jgi:hypothetical protein
MTARQSSAVDNPKEMKMKHICTCCGRTLNPATLVSLELDQRVGEYHDFGGIPESQNQGGFDFGPACAKKARAKAIKALNIDAWRHQFSGAGRNR